LNSSFQSSTLRNGTISESRYTKEQLLGLYKNQREWDNWGKNVTDYFMADWNPRDGAPPAAAWGKKDDQQKDSSGPEVCWDHAGQVQPLALVEMNEDEKDVRNLSSPTSLIGKILILRVALLDFGQLPIKASSAERVKG
jgi:PERQ amino acid-rich with GYF domain-containing protein